MVGWGGGCQVYARSVTHLYRLSVRGEVLAADVDLLALQVVVAVEHRHAAGREERCNNITSLMTSLRAIV